MRYIKKLQKALKNDKELYYAWQANIAMAFYDNFYQYKRGRKKKTLNETDIHTISNNAATYFLDLFIK